MFGLIDIHQNTMSCQDINHPTKAIDNERDSRYPCDSKESCLAFRPKAFAFEKNLLYDQRRQIPCANCKLGRSREEEAAKVRPPTCDRCGEPKKDGYPTKCQRCASIGQRRDSGKLCSICEAPLGYYNRAGICVVCRPKSGRIVKHRKTHCIHGHEFTPETTRIEKETGARKCRECDRVRMRKRRVKQLEGIRGK